VCQCLKLSHAVREGRPNIGASVGIFVLMAETLPVCVAYDVILLFYGRRLMYAYTLYDRSGDRPVTRPIRNHAMQCLQ